MIEIPLRHKETGEAYVFTAQSRTSLAAAKDFLAQCRRLPDAFEPIVRLNVGCFTGALRHGEEAGPLDCRQGGDRGELRGPSV